MNRALQELVDAFMTMPILTDAEVQLLPLGRRRAIRDRERFLERVKNDTRNAAAAQDMLMQSYQREGERARRRREETERIVADIKATPVEPDPDGPENLRRLEAAIAQERRAIGG
ncbi:hypothetical protein [Brevibacterium sp.]|uniref:hypothetical protein n=1 Tax=Brevibacterium sp. TaxID=1701 RepID=UPI0028112F3E|nr:hypothetical protein [Brevibacterium sp.]